MKKLLFSFLIVIHSLLTLEIQAQDYSGMWLGTMKVTDQMSLQIGFDLEKLENGSYSAKMNVIEQKAFDLPMDVCTIEGKGLHLELKDAGIIYDGIFDAASKKVDGTFQQSGGSFELDLDKTDGLPKKIERKQLPKRPFPYIEEEVIFKNTEAGISLSGTLTMPEKGDKFTAVILLPGSGEIDRDETDMGHFLLLSDILTKNGYAVLRYDKRGVGDSEGDYGLSTTYDFADDAAAAVEYMKTRKKIDKKSIGFIGHSEGSLIAPMVAAKNKKDVDFMILMGGVGVKGKELLLKQEETIARMSGVPEETITKLLEKKNAYYTITMEGGSDEEITARLKAFDPSIPDAMLSALLWKWYKTFLSIDPVPYLEKVSCPVLAITGEKDTQCAPELNLPAIEKALKDGGNTNYTVKEIPGQNHLFQKAESGLPYEYEQLEDIIATSTLHQIIKWLNELH